MPKLEALLYQKRNRRVIAVLISLSLSVNAPFAWAAGGRSGVVTNPNTETTTTGTTTGTTNTNNVNNYTGTAANTTATDTAIRNTELNGANNTMAQGNKASNSQNMGMMAGLLGAAFSGGMAAMTCSQKPPSPSCPLWIAGAVASALVAAAMSGAKDKSDQTVTDVTSGGGATPTPTPTDISKTPEMIETTRNLTSATQATGIQANTKTGAIRLPDGRTFNAADIGNPAALAAAGLSSSEIAAFQDHAKKALKEGERQAKARGLDATEGANGEGLGTSGGRASASSDPTVGGGSSGALARDPANTAGLTRDFNGDRIGVASDNIFGLINRRYSHVAGQNMLVVPAANRAPPTNQ